jgi:plastocyanin
MSLPFSNQPPTKGQFMPKIFPTALAPAINSIAGCAVFMLASSLFTIANAGSLSVTVLDKDGKPAADAVVVLQPASKGSPRNLLPLQATIAQEKMQFVPAVTLVGVGAKLRFVNNDAWDHHVRGAAAGLAPAQGASGTTSPVGFELRLEGKSEGKPAKSLEVTMDKPGAQSATLLGCFLHGSMRGHVYVSDSPWAAKTGADGVASFEDVPEGAVQLKVWHPDQLLDLPSQPVTVSGTPAKASVQLQVVPRRRRV